MKKPSPQTQQSLEDDQHRSEMAQRIQAEKNLTYQAILLDQINDGVLGADADARITYWNRGMEKIFGFTEAEALGKTSRELLRPIYASGEREKIMEELERYGSTTALIRTKHKNGQEIIVEVSSTRLTDAQGGLTGYVVIYHDATNRIRAEQSLRLSEIRLNRAQGIAHLGSWELDLSNNQLSWSDEVYRIFGLQPQEFGATYEAFLEAIHPDDRAAVDNAYSSSLLEGRDYYEIEHRVVRRSSGEVRIVHEKCEHQRDDSGRIVRSIGMVHDITESKLMEVALRESEARYHSLFSSMIEGFALHEIICDEAGVPCDYRFLDVNPAFERLTGLKRDEVVGRTLNEVLPQDNPRWLKEYGNVALTGQPVHFEDYSPALNQYYEIFAYSPQPKQFAVIFMNVTERKLAEEALRQSEERFRQQFQELDLVYKSTPVGLFTVDRDMRYVRLNERLAETNGKKVEEHLGRTIDEIVPEIAAVIREQWKPVLEEGVALKDMEVSGFTAGDPGVLHYWLANYYPIRSESGEIVGITGAVMDITERKWMEDEIKKARLEAEQRANELDIIFNSIADAIMVYDAHGNARQFNPAAVEMIGYDPTHETVGGLIHNLSTRCMDGQPLKKENAPTARALKGEKIVGDRYILRNTSGVDTIVNASSSPIWVGEQVTGAVTVLQDVTEQHKIEESQTWLASFPKLNPNPVVELDASGDIHYINPTAMLLFPTLSTEGKEHTWLKDTGDIVKDFRQGTNTTHTREVQVGEAYYLQSAQYIDANQRTRIYGVDITTQKKAEQALREARDEMEQRVADRTQELSLANDQLQKERQRFNDVLEMLPAYLILLTPDYKATFANRFFRERFGESHGRPCYEFLFGRKEPCEICETFKVLQTKKPAQWEWTGPDGHIYAVHDFPFTDVDGSNLILEMGIDITERKLAEAQLRLQTSAMEAAANGIIITNQKGTIQWCNPAFAKMSGYEETEIIGANTRILKSGKHDAQFYDHMWKTLLDGQIWQGEIINRRKDGSLYTEEEIITPVRNEQNQITHFIAIKQDISARKESEEALHLANIYNRSLLEASLDPLVTITPDGKIGDVNSATEDVTGWPRQELIGTDFHNYFSDPEKARQGYQKVFKEGSIRNYELEIRHKDGHATPVLYNSSVYRDETWQDTRRLHRGA